jgi:multisubunit Na+/H+ antiporter MnhB subunit
MMPYIKAGLITAGVIILITTYLIRQYVEKINVQKETLNVDPLNIVSILLGLSLIVIGFRLKAKRSLDSENSAN